MIGGCRHSETRLSGCRAVGLSQGTGGRTPAADVPPAAPRHQRLATVCPRRRCAAGGCLHDGPRCRSRWIHSSEEGSLVLRRHLHDKHSEIVVGQATAFQGVTAADTRYGHWHSALTRALYTNTMKQDRTHSVEPGLRALRQPTTRRLSCAAASQPNAATKALVEAQDTCHSPREAL